MIHKLRRYIEKIKDGSAKRLLEEIKWIYSYGRNHVISIVIYTLLGMSGTVIGLLAGLASRDLVDMITGHQTGELLKTFVMMIVFQLFTVALAQVSNYISSMLSLKVNNSIKADIYDKIMTTEWESLSQYHSGDLSLRWSGDTAAISNGVLTLIPNTIQLFFRFFSALFMVCRYDVSFAVFAIISAPVTLMASKRNLKKMRSTNMNTMSVLSRISTFTTEAFLNIQMVKAFNLVPLYKRRIREIQKEQLKSNAVYQKTVSFNTLFMAIVSSVVTYSTYGWGIYKVWKGDISYGSMTMFLGLSSSLSGSIQSMLSIIPSTVNVTNAAKRLMAISELPKEDYSKEEEARTFYQNHLGSGIGLCVRNTSYTYMTGTEVFQNINFEAHPHEAIALVGPSGEGKTTMLRLLLAIIQSKEGEGYICAGDTTPETGEEYMPLSASTRQLFAYVPQGNTMFSGTIAENMRNLKEDATDEDIIEALKMACAWEFVEKLPDGINSEIKERGGGFSEGQAQRLSIARALVRKSPILLLDEATSALDIATERKVLHNIIQDEYPRTTIVTTHRPSVLKSCDRVYAIRNKSCEIIGQDEIDEMIKGYTGK